jgi:hypothetical protein
MNTEKRKAERRKVTYYIPVTEYKTRRVVGVLMDIGSKGIRLDSTDKVAIGQVRQFFIDLPNEFAQESARIFTGSCRWCIPDEIDPTSCVAGYEFVNPSRDNAAFFQRIFDTYSVKSNRSQFDNSDYMWK